MSIHTKAGRVVCGVYTITHIPSGRLYIGSSVNIDHRMSNHFSLLKSGTHGCEDLQLLWDSTPKEEWVTEIVKECDTTDLLNEERLFLAMSPLALNMVDNPHKPKGSRSRQLTRNKLSESALAVGARPEIIDRRSSLAREQHSQGRFGRAAKGKGPRSHFKGWIDPNPRIKDGVKSGVFHVKHLPSGKVYYGISTNLSNRLTENKSRLNCKRHTSKHLQDLYDSTLASDWDFRVVEFVADKKLLQGALERIMASEPPENIIPSR